MPDNKTNRSLNVLKDKKKPSYRVDSTYSDNARRMTAKQFEVDIYEGKIEFYAIVLSTEATEDFLGSSKVRQPVLQARCYVPEIHACYPLPRSADDHQIIDLFPMFQGTQEEFGKEMVPGTVVRVKFADRDNVSLRSGNGKLIEKMKQTQSYVANIGFQANICRESPGSRVDPNKLKIEQSCIDDYASVRNPKKVNSQWANESTIGDCRTTEGALPPSRLREARRPVYSEHKKFTIKDDTPDPTPTCNITALLQTSTNLSGLCKNGYEIPRDGRGGLGAFISKVALAEAGGSGNYYSRRHMYHGTLGKGHTMQYCDANNTIPKGSQYWGIMQWGTSARVNTFKEIINHRSGNIGGFLQGIKFKDMWGSGKDLKFLTSNSKGPKFAQMAGSKDMCSNTNAWYATGGPPVDETGNPGGKWNTFVTYVISDGPLAGVHLQDILAVYWWNLQYKEVLRNSKVKALLKPSNQFRNTLVYQGAETRVDISSCMLVFHLLGPKGLNKYLDRPDDLLNADSNNTNAKCYAMKGYGFTFTKDDVIPYLSGIPKLPVSDAQRKRTGIK